MWRRGLLLAGLTALIGCGSEPDPSPDREQIRTLVSDFFNDAAAGNAEAICAVMTADGRAWATGRDFLVHEGESLVDARPRRPASMEQCIESDAAGTYSTDLPVAMKNGYRPRVLDLKIADDTARARVGFTGFRRTFAFQRADDAWRIDYFSLPVRE
jgi:hypothetical protein